MPTELPIACSLRANELTGRLAQMADLGGRALLEAELAGRRATVRFAGGAGVREQLTRIVAAESECCAFLAMSVRDEPDVVVLVIEAPEGAEVVVRELVGAFRGEAQAA
jgi:hypothetical protein